MVRRPLCDCDEALGADLPRASFRYHRNYFQKRLRLTLGALDLASIPEYYGLSPASSVFVYVYKAVIIGVIAVDAASPLRDLSSLISDEEATPSEKAEAKAKAVKDRAEGAIEEATGKGTAVAKSSKKDVKNRKVSSSTVTTSTSSSSSNKPNFSRPSSLPSEARIRHFYVDLVYRASAMPSDLLAHALDYTFQVSKQVTELYAPWSPTLPLAARELRAAGFTRTAGGPGELAAGVVGLLKWKTGWMRLTRAEWEREKLAKLKSK